jgi:two-component system, response regulator PdtaR
MPRSLRIIAADDDRPIQQYYVQILTTLGHEVLGVVSTGAELVERCRELEPDLVVTDIKMPDMEGIEAAHKIYQERPLPIILVSGFYDPKVFERAVTEQVVGYLVKPITAELLRAEIDGVMKRFAEFEVLCAESPHFRQALRDRKIVERAKAILMKASQFDESQAFRRLQELARQKNYKIATAAQTLVAASDVKA